MATQATYYNIITNSKGELCILLTPHIIYKGKIENPYILYDGGPHAVLYRNNKDIIILDYLPVKSKMEILKHTEILLVEYNIKKETIVNEYMCKIKHIKQIPEIANLITKK